MPGDVRKRPSTSSIEDEAANFISLESSDDNPTGAKRKSVKTPSKDLSVTSSSSSPSTKSSSSSSRSSLRFRHYTPIKPLMTEEAATKERQSASQSEASIHQEDDNDSLLPTGPNDDPCSECPWVREKGYTKDAIGLHHEIRDFFKYISPTAKEKRVREEVVKRCETVILDLWPNAKVEVFGSYKTGLYLPTSDVDLVVFGRWLHTPLRTLEKAFIAAEVAEAKDIQVIDKASVPIIKVVDKRTEIRVDISFNMPNSILAVELVKDYLRIFPTLKYLVFVLKQFLSQRDLNEVYFGGVSSYSLVLMTISFLQLHPREGARTGRANVGVLLLEFFELYGLTFNYPHVCLRITDGGGYIQKSDFYRSEVRQRCPDKGLSIEDPYTRGNDISRGSYHSDKCVSAFEKAFYALQHAITPARQRFHGERTRSILVNVIQLSPELVEYRRWIESNF